MTDVVGEASELLRRLQGLGKTAQSIATLAFQKQFLGVPGPHIVIAPLTTLGHWKREIQTWTDMVRSTKPPITCSSLSLHLIDQKHLIICSKAARADCTQGCVRAYCQSVF